MTGPNVARAGSAGTSPATTATTGESYAEVSVIVDGALDAEVMFTDETLMLAYLASVGAEAESDGLPTEVYVLWHDHPLYDEAVDLDYDDCACVQYVSDHHPDYSWNVED
jgi:hypothetical protein